MPIKNSGRRPAVPPPRLDIILSLDDDYLLAFNHGRPCGKSQASFKKLAGIRKGDLDGTGGNQKGRLLGGSAGLEHT
ncbi:hypothetical protein SBDP1_50005 [Syntrophobacter sp. SbD1]|nr:hypothetical protein SBDP1_50005 [Syntrophobacter sp. SbD1]